MQRSFIQSFFTVKSHASSLPSHKPHPQPPKSHDPDSLPGLPGTRPVRFCSPGITRRFVSAHNVFHFVSSYQSFALSHCN